MGSGRTVETLDRTGGFCAKVVKRRLLETTQHTLNVHKDIASIRPGGDGFVNSVQVRLLHASVRKRILEMAAARPGYYDVATYGVPVNDLDCIGTIHTFSTTVVWLGLPRQGIRVRDQEAADYIALWRYVAYIMGAPHECLATPRVARVMMESLLASEVNPTPSSAVLANNIIAGMAGTAPTYSSPGFMAAQSYWLNGEQLSSALRIPRPTLWYNALVLGQCMLFLMMAHLNRWFATVDEWNIKVSPFLSLFFSFTNAHGRRRTQRIVVIISLTCLVTPPPKTTTTDVQKDHVHHTPARQVQGRARLHDALQLQVRAVLRPDEYGAGRLRPARARGPEARDRAHRACRARRRDEPALTGSVGGRQGRRVAAVECRRTVEGGDGGVCKGALIKQVNE
ncbi:oxygenase MpaB family protein [Microdochium nivale]|nr:oxygenase MpaB family protein [Microdochium nivale]